MKRGRPRTDRLATVERVAAYLAENPTASARSIAFELRIRKSDALRAARLIHGLAERFPKTEANT